MQLKVSAQKLIAETVPGEETLLSLSLPKLQELKKCLEREQVCIEEVHQDLLKAQLQIRESLEGVEVVSQRLVKFKQFMLTEYLFLFCSSQRIQNKWATLCLQCKEFPRCVLMQPCQHLLLCERCTEKLGKNPHYPHCNIKVKRCTIISL